MLLPIHIVAGGLAIILGAIALTVKKGGRLHRRSGWLFVYAMLVMGFTASMLGFLKSPTDGNVFAGFLSAYFVGTALTTVRQPSPWTRAINVIALSVAVVLALGSVMAGVTSLNTPGRDPGGIPFVIKGAMTLIIATVLSLAAAGDIRLMRSGQARGAPRLKRHLWRMCFALFIAAGSFFSIRERVATLLPEPLTTGPVRALPIVLLFGIMVYWLWRLRDRRTAPVPVRHDAAALANRAT